MARVLAFWPLGLVPLLVAAVLEVLFGRIVDLKITKAQQDLGSIETALGMYKAKHGDFPSEADGLAALTGPGGPLFRLSKDPWGNDYLYRRVAGVHSYLLYSPGVNHLDEGGLGDDVILGPKKYRCSDYGVNCPRTAGQLGALIALLLASISLVVGAVRMGLKLSRLVRRPNHRSRSS